VKVPPTAYVIPAVKKPQKKAIIEINLKNNRSRKR
jgi:hypothetical protein